MESNALILAMTPPLLIGARVGGLMLIIPAFSSRVIPRSIKTGLVLVLTALLMGGGGYILEGSELNLVSILRETFIGFTLGFGAAVLVGAAELAGTVVSVQMGISGAQTLNPGSGQGVASLAQLLGMVVTTIFLVSGAHFVVLESLVESTRLLPVGSPIDHGAGIGHLVRQASSLFGLGLRLASPIVAALLVGNVLLGILGRAVPQLNVLMMAFPLQIGIGLFLLGLALPLMGVLINMWFEMQGTQLESLLSTLSPRPLPVR